MNKIFLVVFIGLWSSNSIAQANQQLTYKKLVLHDSRNINGLDRHYEDKNLHTFNIGDRDILIRYF